MDTKNNPNIKYRKDYQPSQFLIKKTELEFLLFDEHVVVQSKLNFIRNPIDQNHHLQPLALNGVNLLLLAIFIDNEKLTEQDYQINSNGLTVQPPKNCFQLTTQVKIHPQQNSSLEGLYTSNRKFCTQCEAEGFRKITYYLDRPDVMSEFFVRIEADKSQYPLLLSNGNPINKGDLDNGRHFACWHDPFCKPSYLFALVAGDLDCLESEFVTMNQRKIKLQLFVDKGKLDQCQFAMDSLVKAMRWDEEKFGLEYDLDLYMIVAVNDFNMGAMENKGLNIFNTAYVLANQKTATDTDFKGVEQVIAHEYFHNWTGNRVTCRDWFQLSLKEGLTVFRDQKFSEEMQSSAVERIQQVKIVRSAQFAEDSGPMAHPIRPDSYIEMNNFYTVTVYNKGAEVIRMMHTMLTEKGFRLGMNRYFERHDGQAVTCEDFIVAMEDANQVNWKNFRNWYRQSGTPTVQIKLDISSDRLQKMTVTQSCPSTPDQPFKEPFMIPIKIAFFNAKGEPLLFKLLPPIDTTSTINKQQDFENDFVFEELIVTEKIQQKVDVFFKQPETSIVPSFLRSFTAPVKLEYDYSVDQLACLFAYDDDTFNRWDAGQKLMTKLLLSNNSTIDTAQTNTLLNAVGQLLKDQQIDPSLKALSVVLPDLNSLIGQLDQIDLDVLFSKHKSLKTSIANQLQSQWQELYQRLNSLPFEKQTAGDRHLKNTALSYLMLSDPNQYAPMAYRQQKSACCMSDEISALQLLAKSETRVKIDAIQKFYQRWEKEDLVIDKWLSAQVMTDSESVIDDIEALLSHSQFSIKNPNRVRAVLGHFVGANTSQFHSATGLGYELLTKQIINLNNINPQIAARLTKHFGPWRKFDDKRQALIREQLETIRSIDNLAKDINEVVDNYLQH